MVALGVQVPPAPTFCAVDQVPDVEQVVTLPPALAVLVPAAPLKVLVQVAVGDAR